MPALQFFSTQDAAAYCHITVRTLRYHIYVSKSLVPDGRVGRAIFFYRSNLDKWRGRRALALAARVRSNGHGASLAT